MKPIRCIAFFFVIFTAMAVAQPTSLPPEKDIPLGLCVGRGVIVHDGLSIVDGKLTVALRDGRILCY